MLPIEFLFQENVEPGQSLATDRYFLNSFHKQNRPHSAVLRVYTMRGDLVCAGRYHLVRTPTKRLWRRLSGGRAVAFGDGFVGFSLLLPHRSALESDDPFRLAPEQVPNRCVRGVLAALRGLGIEALYPGRDTITVRRRAIGLVSFESDEHGALAFEGFLALERDFGLLDGLLAAVDTDGYLRGERLEAVTSVRAESERTLTARALADALRLGYAGHFGTEAHTRELSPLEERAVAAVEAREFGDGWLSARVPRADLPLVAAVRGPLGVLEAQLVLEQDRFLREVQLSGDFIANSPAIETLERELRLCPADWRSIALVTDRIFNRPENYFLGFGRPQVISEVIARALPG